jgi:hypothetical protein
LLRVLEIDCGDETVEALAEVELMVESGQQLPEMSSHQRDLMSSQEFREVSGVLRSMVKATPAATPLAQQPIVIDMKAIVDKKIVSITEKSRRFLPSQPVKAMPRLLEASSGSLKSLVQKSLVMSIRCDEEIGELHGQVHQHHQCCLEKPVH